MADKEPDSQEPESSECVIPGPEIPAHELHKYMSESDQHSAQDIARYVEIEASDEVVLHVEKVKSEVVLGDVYEVWDVHTDKDR
jgi:hypothetical protein